MERSFPKSLGLVLGVALLGLAVGLIAWPVVAQEPIVIRYADTMSDPMARAGEGAVIAELLDRFMEENPDIKVEVVWGSGNFDVHYMGGVSPDVARFTHEPLRTRAARGMLLPLDEFVEKDNFDLSTLFPAVVDEGFRHEGKLYGMPMYFGTLAAHYNVNMFNEAGLAHPTGENWSWEEDFVEAGRKLLRDRTGDGEPDQWIASYHASNLLAPLMAARGSAFVSDDLTQWLGAEPSTVETLQWLQDQIHLRGIIAHPQADRAAFVAGRTAYQPFGSWGLTGMHQDLTFEWDLAEMPRSELTGRRGTRWNADGWAISNQTEHPEAAWRLVKFIASETAQEIIARGRLGIPVHIDVARHLFDDPTTLQDESLFLRAVDYMWIDRRHEVPRETRDYINRAINEIVNGLKPARVALEEITSSVEAGLGVR